MKVLKEGRPQKGWAREFECSGKGNGNGGCGALLLVEHEDLYLTHHYDYGGGHDTFRTFRCESCGVQTDVEDCPRPKYKSEKDKRSAGMPKPDEEQK